MQKCYNVAWIIFFKAFFFKDPDDLERAEWSAIYPCRSHRIINIRNRNKLCISVDLIRFQSKRITASVTPLMMHKCTQLHFFRQEVVILQNTVSSGCMCLYDIIFLFCEFSRFRQHFYRNCNFSNVMKQTALRCKMDFIFIHTNPFRQNVANQRNIDRVCKSCIIIILDSVQHIKNTDSVIQSADDIHGLIHHRIDILLIRIFSNQSVNSIFQLAKIRIILFTEYFIFLCIFEPVLIL